MPSSSKATRELQRLYEELHQLSSSPADLLIQSTGSILGGTLRIEDLADLVLDRAIQDCGARRGFVLLDADAGRIHVLTARSAPAGDLHEPWKLISNTVVQRVLSSRRPIFSRDAMRDPTLSSITSVQRLSVHSLLCFPLLWQGQAIGAVYLESEIDRFGERERAVAEELAEKAATVLGTILSVQNYRRLIEGLRQEIHWLRRQSLPSETPSVIVGRSPVLGALKMQAAQVARTELTVLVVGETGTGKDLFARWIHDLSPRRTGPFVPINCAAVQDSLAESELFGHSRGAFTGATADLPGRVEQAQGGTLFLNEIGDMSPAVQAKMLQLLESGEYFRLGDPKKHQADIRVVAATNRDLPGLIREGRFRQDLFYRLDQYRLQLPPLRERVEDVELLAEHTLSQCSPQGQHRFEAAALELLRRHGWPGNVRELGHLVRRCLVGLEPGTSITAEVLRRYLPQSLDEGMSPSAKGAPERPVPLREALQRFEREYLEREMARYPDLSRPELAERLGLPVRTLYQKISELGLRPDSR